MSLDKVRRVHCIGVGGIGVSGLAELLCQRGYTVSGSDQHETATTRRLAALGVKIVAQPAIDAVQSADLVVYSSAISATHPEREMAQACAIAQMKRGVLLAALMTLTAIAAGSRSRSELFTPMESPI